MRWRGRTYRAHDPRWSFQPLSGEGAAILGGRFNARGTPALYLSLDATTALIETVQGFVNRLNPTLVCEYDVDCEDVIDLCDDDVREPFGVKLSDLSGPWQDEVEQGLVPVSRKIANMLIAKGTSGVLVPSFAPGVRD